jgi:anti-sigma factor RsiW
MLSERHLQLLTAFVDCELTRRQRKAVLRLLHESSEARSVLQDLQEATHCLRELPHRKLGEGFAGQVLQAITDRGLLPAPDPEPVIRRAWPRWTAYVAAACVALAVGAGIFLATRPSPNTGALAVNNPSDLPDDPNSPSTVVPEARLNPPLRMTFKELAEKPKSDMLAQQLKKESAVRLDVTVGDNANAVRHLQDVLQRKGIKLLGFGTAEANLKKGGQGKIEYLVYTEDLRAEELEAILQQLADAPKPPLDSTSDAEAKQSAPKSAFESMVVASLSAADLKSVAGHLGVETSQLALTTRGFTLNATPKENSSTGTPIRAPQYERYAVVMANDPATGPVASQEVQMFLAGQKQQRPGTAPVLLVIRQG